MSIRDELLRIINGERPAGYAKPLEPQAAPTHVEMTRYVVFGGITVELPDYDFGWESHHSTENQVGNIKFIAPALCDQLGLRNRGDSVDLYDPDGKPATLFRSAGTGDDSRSRLLYLRRDLLHEYLKATEQSMLWTAWGERELSYDHVEQYRSELQPVWKKYRHIHRSLFEYESGMQPTELSSAL